MTPAEAVVDPIALSAWDLAIASSLVGINGLLSLWLGLNLGRKLLVASVRTLVQLVALGFVLTWVFEAANAPVVIAMAVAMIVLAAGAATKRASRTYAGARMASFAALMVGAGVTLSAATFGIASKSANSLRTEAACSSQYRRAGET